MRVMKDGQEYLVRPGTTPSQLAPQSPSGVLLEPIVNGRRLSEQQRSQPLRENDSLEFAARDVVKALGGV